MPCPPFPQPALSVCYSARHDTNSGQEKKKQKVKYSQHPCSTFLVTRFKSLTFASPGLRFGCDTYKYFFNSWVQQQFELPTLGIWITIVFCFSKWIFNPSIPWKTAAESKGVAEYGLVALRPHPPDAPTCLPTRKPPGTCVALAGCGVVSWRQRQAPASSAFLSAEQWPRSPGSLPGHQGLALARCSLAGNPVLGARGSCFV